MGSERWRMTTNDWLTSDAVTKKGQDGGVKRGEHVGRDEK